MKTTAERGAALSLDIRVDDVTAASSPLLEVTGLSCRYGGVRALEAVTLAIGSSERVGIVGPNGSGKTTFLNVVSGLLRPRSGRVFWKGTDITSLSMAGRSRRGLIRSFQHTMVFPMLSVRENLQMPGVARQQRVPSEQEVKDLLDMVGLPTPVLEKKGAELSWGQSRLLGVALALACQPEMIMLDEPLAGLAPAAADSMVSILSHLKGGKISLVIVEHSVGRLASMTDRMILFHEGSNVADGDPHELLSSDVLKRVYFGVAGDQSQQS